MASSTRVEAVGLSKSTLMDKVKSKTKSLKGGIQKNKKKWEKPLGFQRSLKEDETNLEKLVLGEASSLFKESTEATAKSTKLVQTKSRKQKKQQKATKDSKPKPAWTDQDPTEYTAKRVKKFETYNGNPQWAKLQRKRISSSSDEEDNEVLQHAGNLLSRSTIKHASLAKGTLEFKRNLDLNSDSDIKGYIRAVEFHPAATVGLVGYSTGTVALYEVNGRTNPKLQSIYFENFYVTCAKFATNGTEFLVGSHKAKHLYSYDMEAATSTKISASKEMVNFKNFKVSPDGSLIAVTGHSGFIHLLTARSKEVVGTLKMNADVKAIEFNTSGTRLYSHGYESELYVWDVNGRTCIERFHDDGCLTGTALATSSQYLATGSTSGAVNIYSATAASRTPLKTVLNLLTPIDGLTFNASEELLAMYSSNMDNAIRLVHLPSFTVFANFPGRSKDLGNAATNVCINRVAFSPNGGFLAVGGQFKVSLIRLKHYGNY